MVQISSLMPVNDINGKEIQSQAPYVVKFGEKWYMYGVDMSTYVFPSVAVQTLGEGFSRFSGLRGWRESRIAVWGIVG